MKQNNALPDTKSIKIKNDMHLWNTRSQWVAVALLVVITFVVYLNTLFNGFVYDDYGTIVENSYIKNLGKNFSSFFNASYFKISGEASYRPIATLSYYLIYQISGLNPLGYHLVSLIFQIANVILVYSLARRILRPKLSAFIASLLFACHPALSEPVNAISYNEDLFAAFFFLLALIIYIDLNPTRYVLSLCLFFLGLLSKEMAITLPSIIFLYDLALRDTNNLKLTLTKLWDTIRGRKLYYLGYLAVSAFYLSLRFYILQDPKETIGPQWGSVLERIIYLPDHILTFIKLAVFPLHLNADHAFSYPTLFDVSLLIPFSVVCALVALSFMAYRRFKEISFGIWWFIITLFPVYNIVQLFNPIAERYLYIPLIGFCLAISASLNRLFDALFRNNMNKANAVKILVLTLIIIFYAAITIPRNSDWKDSYTLWSKTLEDSPDSFRAHGNLGRVYQEKGMVEDALRETKKTIELKPNHFKAYYNLGVIYEKQGLFEEAESAYNKAVKIKPDYANAHFNLGNLYKKKNLLEKASRAYQKTIEINSDDIEARNNLGVIYALQGQLDKAISEWEIVLKLEPNNENAKDNIKKAKQLKNNSN
jgi:Flp pilus assembly protein TadD